MKKKEGLFVKINYKMDFNSRGIKEKGKGERESLHNSNFKKYLFCAGVYNKNGGTMIFQAKDLDEAKDIIYNNPFCNAPVYNYEILNKDNIAL